MVKFTKPFIVISTIGTAIGGIALFKDSVVGKDLSLDKDVTATDKVVIVTGSNTGIGKETVRDLASRGAKVYMACRDLKKCERTREEIILETKNPLVYCRKCDLADFDSIRRFVEKFKQHEDKLDVLIANGGVMRSPRLLTKQGIELQLGVNHMGHFLLTDLLLDVLKKSAPSRVIVVSSAAHHSGKIDFDDLNSEKAYDPGTAYNNSKLANILFANELARRLQGTGVTVNSVHPGLVATELGRHMNISKSFFGRNFAAPILKIFLKSPKQGAYSSIYLALEPSLSETTGKYFSDCAEAKPSPKTEDMEVAARLWATSAKWTGVA